MLYWCFFAPTVQGGDTLYQKNQRKDEEHWPLVFCLSDGSHLFLPYTQLKAIFEMAWKDIMLILTSTLTDNERSSN